MDQNRNQTCLKLVMIVAILAVLTGCSIEQQAVPINAPGVDSLPGLDGVGRHTNTHQTNSGPGGERQINTNTAGEYGHFPGTWHGTNTNPWTSPYPVEFTFRADGTYSARALSMAFYNGSDRRLWSPALYYGTDEDSTIKTYGITGAGSDGNPAGFMVILFDVVYTTVRGDVSHILFSNDGNRLEFDLYNRGYGPVHFTLFRTGAVCDDDDEHDR